MSNVIQALHALGQSIWYDNIHRKLLDNGEMAAMIARGEIRGVTSNPSIFQKSIAQSDTYTDAIRDFASQGLSAEQIYERLAVADIRAATDLFAELYQQTDGGDGYVSLEVSPYLANDTQATLSEARRLWKVVDRSNLMIKIPGTKAGLPAIMQAIADGINVNVTLLFSVERYREVMEAYLSGLEQRAAAGKSLAHVASVASFFVSRVDTMIDPQIPDEYAHLRGKIAVANAKLAYQAFQEVFQGERCQKLAAQGARVQRPLWASTSTKNSAYSDIKYVEELIGPQTVNTVPPHTLKAFGEHGHAALTLEEGMVEAQNQVDALQATQVSLAQVTRQLEENGVNSFADAFTKLMNAITEKAEL